MEADTTKLTIRLPRDQVEFVKRFAKASGLTVTEVISRYLDHLRAQTPGELSEELRKVVGIIPSGTDLDAARFQHLSEKHRR